MASDQKVIDSEGALEEDILVEVFGRTDIGLIRNRNEDNFLVADLTRVNCSLKPEVRKHKIGGKGSLFLVSDGMGGAAGGEVASKLAGDTIYEYVQQRAKGRCESAEECAEIFKRSVEKANAAIHQRARSDPNLRGMGATITAARVLRDKLCVAQVGDSRAYILRDRRIIQVTKDQSIVGELVSAGEISEADAKFHRHKNIITQALGIGPTVNVDLNWRDLKSGDHLIICSDGLSDPLEDEDMISAIENEDSPTDACKNLVELAKQKGGDDNITCIVARFSGAGLSQPRRKDVKANAVGASSTRQPSEIDIVKLTAISLVLPLLFITGLLAYNLFSASKFCHLEIITVPPDAHVILDGDEAREQKSPFVFNRLPSGGHSIILKKNGYKDQTLHLDVKGGEIRLTVQLVPDQEVQ